MPAIQEAVSARVLGPEQAASTTSGAGSVYEGKTIADMPRLHPPAGAVERAMPAKTTRAKPPTIPHKTR